MKLKNYLKTYLKTYLFSAITAVSLASSTGCGLLTPQPSLDDIASINISHEGSLECGVSKVKLDTEFNPTRQIAGFGPYDRLSSGTLFDKQRNQYQNSYSRAVVFYNGGEIAEGKNYLAYVSVDLLVITEELKTKVESLISKDIIPVLHATHPHSSIGAYWEGRFPELAMGTYDENSLIYLSNKIAKSINLAKSNLQTAKIAFAKTKIEGLQKNRRDVNLPVDTRFSLISIKNNQGEDLADLIWFAAHPTNLPYDVSHFSSDFPGAITRNLEIKEKGENQSWDYLALFFQGGLGDVKVKVQMKPEDYSGDRLQNRINKVEVFASALQDKIKDLKKEVEFSNEFSDKLYINHMSPKFNFGLVNVNMIPDWLQPLDLIGRIWIGLAYIPDEPSFELTNFNNGFENVIVGALPFELVSELSINLRNRLEKTYDTAIISSLCNGWMGYLLPLNDSWFMSFSVSYGECFAEPGFSENFSDYVVDVANKIPKKK